MSQITVEVMDKSYVLACANGEEERLRALTQYVDQKAKDLSSRLGHINESRLLLMAAVVIADELQEATESKGGPGILNSITDDMLTHILNEVSAEVEAIAEQLEDA